MEKNNKDLLIDHLVRFGKTHSWEELADKFSLRNGEIARGIWKNHRKAQGGTIMGHKNEVEAQAYVAELEDRITAYEEDLKGEKASVSAITSKQVTSLDDLIKVCKIDTVKWQVQKYTQSAAGTRYNVKAWLEPKETKGLAVFQDNFLEFLKKYQPAARPRGLPMGNATKDFGCLVINKQDAHLNKLDTRGENDFEERLDWEYEALQSVVEKARVNSDLEEIIYVIGSDQFNSEWNSMTTKGTPQQNMASFYKSFEIICEHEVNVIDMLLSKSEFVNVVFVSGNHDEYISWHLLNWLKSYFRNEERVEVDDSPEYTKYLSYSNTLMMFNHGDVMKPEKLAGVFPIECKDRWSEHDYFYIFTGDKHHLLAKDINGIQFYQIPALSSAKSRWDEKQGFLTDKPGLTAFLVIDGEGVQDIYKKNAKSL